MVSVHSLNIRSFDTLSILFLAAVTLTSAYADQSVNVAPPSAALYLHQQQCQAMPTAGATACSQRYASGKYAITATPPQPVAPVSI